ncbi:hypothetical protein KEM52_004058, partial [Ascosphaera acerosa]
MAGEGMMFRQPPGPAAVRRRLKAPRWRDSLPVYWTYLHTPPVGTLLCVWSSHADFGTDGYLWGAPEQVLTVERSGFTIEVRVQRCGYVAPDESVAQYTRHRYRFIAGPAQQAGQQAAGQQTTASTAAAIDPMLWL